MVHSQKVDTGGKSAYNRKDCDYFHTPLQTRFDHQLMPEAVFFYTFTTLMVVAALSVVFNRQPVYSVLSLLAVMFCLAALFVMLHAPFVAALQVLLYAGAVLVLFLFVVMLLNLQPETLRRVRAFTIPTVGIGGAVWLFTQLAALWLKGMPNAAIGSEMTTGGTVESIGRLLFTTYLLPFELVSFLILAAIIGAVTLAKQEAPRK